MEELVEELVGDDWNDDSESEPNGEFGKGDESEEGFTDDDDLVIVVAPPVKKRASKQKRVVDPETRKRRLEQHELLKNDMPSNTQAVKQPRLDGGSVIPLETKAECRKREKQELAERSELRKQHDQLQKLRVQLQDIWCKITGASDVTDLCTLERKQLDAMVDVLTAAPPFVGTAPRKADNETLKALGAKFDRASKTWHAPDHPTLLRLLETTHENAPLWTLTELPPCLNSFEKHQNLCDLCKNGIGALTAVFGVSNPDKKGETSSETTGAVSIGGADANNPLLTATSTPPTPSYPTFSPLAWLNELPQPDPSYERLMDYLRRQLANQLAKKPIDADTEVDTQLLAQYGLPPEAPLFFYKVNSAFGLRKTKSMASRLVGALLDKKTTVDALKEAWVDVRSGRVSHEEVLARIQAQRKQKLRE